ncbi:YcbK family protein [Polyangium fumosum]|uniref:DUF882 domain-containing protein n=1 Tax=Polyangium fumosum TaxID=889272 RepID=A0A4U1JB79_9BACT|nr:D-Ala-D-Ala carboxypeptidase family metallohydrolase [Polyangium fumosum]TKD06602.1 DUF882 domain-containing protein [Polyangium fumosum]
MVSGRYGRIRRRVASTLAAVLTLAAPFAFGEAFAEEAAPKAAEPAKAQAPAKTEKAPEEPQKTAAAPKKRKNRRKAPPKRMVQAEPKTAEVANKAASTKAKPEAATKPATHEKGATTTAGTKAASAKKSEGATTTASTKTTSAKKSEGAAGVSRTKKASTRTPSKKRKGTKKAEAETDRPPCFAPAVSIDRNGLEGETFSLVDCKGKVLDDAREKLSVLARPWGTPRPELPKAKKPDPRAAKQEKPAAAKGKGGKEKEPAVASHEIAPNVRLLDPGLLSRVEAIAKHFPGKGISLVSGYRPKSRGSLHQSARALDLRVAGVSNEEVVAFCKTIADTGCGYYPNSSFVHVDVRTPGTGSVTWIDASGPGEAPRYVSQWPPPPEPADAPATSPVAAVDEAMEQQGKEQPATKEPQTAAQAPKDPPAAQAPTNPTAQPPAEKDEEPKEADPKDPVPPPKKTQPTPPPAAPSPTTR